MVESITITGSRSVGEVIVARLESLFERYLLPFARSEPSFFVGGAIGIDTEALNWLAERTRAVVTVVVPCAVDDQPAVAAEAIALWRAKGRLIDVVELGAPTLNAAAYYTRNRWMVDRSELVIGFPRGAEDTSGTWYTLKQLRRESRGWWCHYNR